MKLTDSLQQNKEERNEKTCSLKIILACSQFPPTKSGYARHAFELAKGFAEAGHDVKVITESQGCARIGQICYLTHEGKSLLDRGCDVAPKDSEALARAIIRGLALPSFQIIDPSRGLDLSAFSWKRIALTYLSAYEKILNPDKRISSCPSKSISKFLHVNAREGARF